MGVDRTLSLLFLFICLFIVVPSSKSSLLFLTAAFSPTAMRTRQCRSVYPTVLFSNKSNGGYRFGDLTRGAINRFQGRVNSLTGKSKAKERLENFTNKPNYQFGDISREIVRRLVNGEYDRDDLLLLLKIAATIGINMQPVAQVLPMKVLMDLLNLSLETSIAQSVGEKVITSITNEIDARMKEMVTGDREYQFGDYTKRIVNRWTGKETYEFGDMTKTILGRLQEREEDNKRLETATVDSQCEDAPRSTTTSEIVLELDKTEQGVLEAWDKEFFQYQREKEGLAPSRNDDDDMYRDWDERYLSSQEGIIETKSQTES